MVRVLIRVSFNFEESCKFIHIVGLAISGTAEQFLDSGGLMLGLLKGGELAGTTAIGIKKFIVAV